MPILDSPKVVFTNFMLEIKKKFIKICNVENYRKRTARSFNPVRLSVSLFVR